MENKGKSGIYIWINKKNNNSYVGSGLDLGDNKKGRLTRYFWNSCLHRKDSKSLIHRAIIKHRRCASFFFYIRNFRVL